MQTCHLPWYNGDVVANNKGANNMGNECIPARLRNGEIAPSRQARRIARKVLTEREGPPPTPKHVCRHLCQNDSMTRNGFLCVIHTTWGTYSENNMDQAIEIRRARGKVAGKIVCNLEHTCPYCGRSGIGPAFRGHINKRKCARPQ